MRFRKTLRQDMALLRLQKFVKSKTSGCGIMNQTNGAHHPVLGVEASGNAMSYTNSTFQTAATVPPTGSPAVAKSSPSRPQLSFPASQADHHAYHRVQHFHSQQQQQQLQAFWANQMREIEQATDFKNHILPLARIKKIMKADEDVRMISTEAPVIFVKACEIFILELTLRSWIHTEENKRRTLLKNDIAAAISRTDVFDFLVDIIPGDELKGEGLGVTKATIPFVGSSASSIPYYYPVGPPGFMVEKPPDQASICPVQQPQPSLSFMPWPQLQPQPQPRPQPQPHPSQSQKRQ